MMPKACWRSPVLVHVVFSACTGSNDYAGPVSRSRITQLPCCLPPTHQGVGILIRGFTKLNHPAHRCLDLRFATHLAMCHARLEVRMDSLFPFLQGLAPLQHVGLSRRTADYRPTGSKSKCGLCPDCPQLARNPKNADKRGGLLSPGESDRVPQSIMAPTLWD